MKALLQRVTQARVDVSGQTVGAINAGLLLLVGIEKADNDISVTRMAERLLAYRVFADDAGRMNRSVGDVSGELLVVSQFTLAADTRKGRRPSFSSAADPEQAQRLYQLFISKLLGSGLVVESGHFGADMQVSLCNDGPVTFLLET